MVNELSLHAPWKKKRGHTTALTSLRQDNERRLRSLLRRYNEAWISRKEGITIPENPAGNTPFVQLKVMELKFRYFGIRFNLK